ncbi:MAG TPA: DUF2585 family protein, partial [Pyrinomonadaceae bacterium]|nr:DUF2585 family protein [Pyrinomonadaceae bacterium]
MAGRNLLLKRLQHVYEGTAFARTPLYACAAVLFAVALIESWQGRVWWCPAGDYSPWSWAVMSQHNSQHFIDPYTFTHMLHGMTEFFIIRLLFPRVPLAWSLFLALGVEGCWEAVENTDYVINRYREVTISLNYYGDSIVNSLSDIACCGLGFLLARKLRFWRSAALFVITEIVLMLTIHDSLIINVIQLIYPTETLRHWQN